MVFRFSDGSNIRNEGKNRTKNIPKLDTIYCILLFWKRRDYNNINNKCMRVSMRWRNIQLCSV